MQKEILEQRELVDQLMKVVERINDLNNKIKDQNFKTDILISIGQHRHKFENENVADHSECICFECISGSYEGVTGGLMFLCDNNPLFSKAVIQTSSYVLKKSVDNIKKGLNGN